MIKNKNADASDVNVSSNLWHRHLAPIVAPNVYMEIDAPEEW